MGVNIDMKMFPDRLRWGILTSGHGFLANFSESTVMAWALETTIQTDVRCGKIILREQAVLKSFCKNIVRRVHPWSVVKSFDTSAAFTLFSGDMFNEFLRKELIIRRSGGIARDEVRRCVVWG
jgi:hypothetical protein